MAVGPDLDAPALFQTYIQRTVQAALEQLEGSGTALPFDDDRDLALHTLTFALELPTAWDDTSRLLMTLAPKMEQAGFRSEWMALLDEGIQTSQRRGDRRTEGELRLQKGVLCQFLTDYDGAAEQFGLSERCFRVSGDARARARVWNRQASLARRQGKQEEAGRLVAAALEVLQDADAELGYSYLVLGLIALDERRWPEAVENFEVALRLFERADAQRYQAWCHSNLGLVRWYQGELELAENHLLRAIGLFERIGDPIHRGSALINLGNVYIDRGQPASALACYGEAEPIFRQAQDTLNQAMIYNNMGKAYREMGRFGEALPVCQRSVALFGQLPGLFNHLNAMEGLGETYLALECFGDAQGVFEAILRQLPGMDNVERRAKMEARMNVYLEGIGRAREARR
ncbi:MAG: tetratricopeptide repeat protein [Chloroflexota bacterium]|nr:tetratricopeptide repeat protein [Chloroflexota bacterium]